MTKIKSNFYLSIRGCSSRERIRRCSILTGRICSSILEVMTSLSFYRLNLDICQSYVSSVGRDVYTEFVLYLQEPWDNNSCRGMCNPDNVAELVGTMDSTGVAAQQNLSLLSETDWPGVTEIHFKTRRHLCNKALYSNNVAEVVTLELYWDTLCHTVVDLQIHFKFRDFFFFY